MREVLFEVPPEGGLLAAERTHAVVCCLGAGAERSLSSVLLLCFCHGTSRDAGDRSGVWEISYTHTHTHKYTHIHTHYYKQTKDT